MKSCQVAAKEPSHLQEHRERELAFQGISITAGHQAFSSLLALGVLTTSGALIP